jgi:hypothetical protein
MHYFRKNINGAVFVLSQCVYQELNSKILFGYVYARQVSEGYCKYVLRFTAEKPC